MEIQCKGHAKKTGERCKKAATAFSEFCVQHRAAVTAATVVELPAWDDATEFVGTVEYDAAAPNVHEVKDADGNVTSVFVTELKGPTGDVFVAPFGTKPEDFPEGWIEVGTTDQGWKFEDLSKPEPEETKGFAGLKARSQPTPRCTIKSCHMVRGHGGKHENGSTSVATCAAKSCRLPLNHSGEHGQPARERVRIGELTGKL